MCMYMFIVYNVHTLLEIKNLNIWPPEQIWTQIGCSDESINRIGINNNDHILQGAQYSNHKGQKFFHSDYVHYNEVSNRSITVVVVEKQHICKMEDYCKKKEMIPESSADDGPASHSEPAIVTKPHEENIAEWGQLYTSMTFSVENAFVSPILPSEDKKDEKIKKVLKETKGERTKHQRQRKAKKDDNEVVFFKWWS